MALRLSPTKIILLQMAGSAMTDQATETSRSCTSQADELVASVTKRTSDVVGG